MPVQFLTTDARPALAAWLREHPDGFCIELYDGDRPPLLHRSGCPHLGVEAIDWSPIPVCCFDDERDLMAWYNESDQVGIDDEMVYSLERCDVCRPDSP